MTQQLVLFTQQLLWEQWPQQRFFEGCWDALTQVFPQELPLKAYQMAETERRRLAELKAVKHVAKRMRTLSMEDTSLWRENSIHEEMLPEYDDSPSKWQRWVAFQGMLEAPCWSKKGAKQKRVSIFLFEEE